MRHTTKIEITCKTATAVGVMPYYSAKALACQGTRQALEEPDERESLTSGFGDWLYRVHSIIPDEIGRKVVTYIAKFNFIRRDKSKPSED
ncbi:secreted protein [Candidatus Thiomargarita nelsonii]|uniref:Secreted protein n=1 Tax=Candidatus Thiomargarita nelsonii TaxID=1003181 RepID=A0A176S396_9GAMM|nr:secreted protein [Candidatus Thiomargarita nelsonii]